MSKAPYVVKFIHDDDGPNGSWEVHGYFTTLRNAQIACTALERGYYDDGHYSFRITLNGCDKPLPRFVDIFVRTSLIGLN